MKGNSYQEMLSKVESLTNDLKDQMVEKGILKPKVHLRNTISQFGVESIEAKTLGVTPNVLMG